MTKRKKSTALVRRAKPTLGDRLERAIFGRRVDRAIAKAVKAAAPAPAAKQLDTLGDDPYLGDLALVEIRLTPEEEAILARPVNVDDVLVKPTGQPYLSHPAYTKWLNDAFGRFGWGLRPVAKPVASQPLEGRVTVMQPFILYVHGQPVAVASGEHEYYEKNQEQTYGDALEALVASALRRCCKRRGIGLELWDKTFLNKFLAERCVRVWVEGETKPRTRRIIDQPFYKERGPVEDRAPVRREEGPRELTYHPAEPAAAHHAKLDDPITTGPKSQHTRLWAIAGRVGRKEDDVHAWLLARYGLKSTKEIPRRLYDEICNWLEQPGPLPPKVIR